MSAPAGPRSVGPVTGLPALLGVVLTHVAADRVEATLAVTDAHLAPVVGYLHAGTVVALADTACGYGCLAALPATATGFTTLELKSNHLGTAAPNSCCTRLSQHEGIHEPTMPEEFA